MSGPGAALEARRLTKRFGGVVALDEVDIAIHAGQVTALLGENGAGKSTFVACCSGAHTPDSGEILIDGVVQQLTSPHVAAAAGVAVVHQEPQMLEHQSVAENLYVGDLASRTRQASRSTLEARAAERLAELGLGDVLDPRSPMSSLSGAHRQLVEIARALLRTPSVLFLDEPNASLGDEETNQIFAVVERMRESGVAVVLVSHRLAEVYRIADRVIIMRDGRKVAEGSVEEIPLGAAIEAMGGRRSRAGAGPAGGRPGAGGAVADGAVVADSSADAVALDALALDAASAADQPPVLELRGASGPGFSDVDLEVRGGEILGMAGLVGSGRTEIALGAVGAVPLSAGEVRVSGRRRRLRSPGDALAHGVVYIPEDRKDAVFYDKSIGVNIRASLLGPRRRGAERRPNDAQARRLTEELAARLAVKASWLGAPARSLSGGNQQKLLFARAAAVRPRVVILDEPTHGVDIGSRAEIHELIRSLAADGIAVWVISSELEEVLALATRVVVVREGRIEAEVPAGSDPIPILAAALGANAAAMRSET